MAKWPNMPYTGREAVDAFDGEIVVSSSEDGPTA